MSSFMPVLDPAQRERRRPRRPDACGHKGSEAAAPPILAIGIAIAIEPAWRAAGPGGLMPAGTRAARPLPLQFSLSVSLSLLNPPGGPPAPAAYGYALPGAARCVRNARGDRPVMRLNTLEKCRGSA